MKKGLKRKAKASNSGPGKLAERLLFRVSQAAPRVSVERRRAGALESGTCRKSEGISVLCLRESRELFWNPKGWQETRNWVTVSFQVGRNRRNEQTDRQERQADRDRQTDRQAGRQAGRQADRHRQTDGQTDR